MSEAKSKSGISIRDLQTFDDLQKAEELEREVWDLADRDVLPTTIAVATRESGSIWLGAFENGELVGFAFGFLGVEGGQLMVHSHMLAVRTSHRNLDLGYQLKLAQRERVLALRIQGSGSNESRVSEMTWTFDPLQSKNAHLNFKKLGVVSDKYKINFYGPETSSVLHRNGTDRLWVRWPLMSRRVRERLQGKEDRVELVDALSRLMPLVQFNGDGKPVKTDLSAALSRQRIAIEIPSDIGLVEQKDPLLARQWREATRWAFTKALRAGFIVAEFCRTVRGKQGPGAYLLEKERLEEYVPEMGRGAVPSR
jgi:predicted GNAT superfamily acetyltransferase